MSSSSASCQPIARYGVEPRARDAADRALGDVQVGRKIAEFADDGMSAGIGAQGSDDRLEQVRRGGVADDHLIRSSADQRRDLCPDALRCLDPTLIPAADQPLAPLPRRQVGERRWHRLRQRPQRIAVEVDDTLRQHEPVAVRPPADRRRRASARFVARHRSAARIRRFVSAQAGVSGAMSSTCSGVGHRMQRHVIPRRSRLGHIVGGEAEGDDPVLAPVHQVLRHGERQQRRDRGVAIGVRALADELGDDVGCRSRCPGWPRSLRGRAARRG